MLAASRTLLCHRFLNSSWLQHARAHCRDCARHVNRVVGVLIHCYYVDTVMRSRSQYALPYRYEYQAIDWLGNCPSNPSIIPGDPQLRSPTLASLIESFPNPPQTTRKDHQEAIHHTDRTQADTSRPFLVHHQISIRGFYRCTHRDSKDSAAWHDRRWPKIIQHSECNHDFCHLLALSFPLRAD